MRRSRGTSPGRSPAFGVDTFHPLASVLARLLRQAGLGDIVALAQITQRWTDIVGPQLAAVSCPEGLRGRTLFVAVADAMWLQQLMFYQAQVLRNIRRVLGPLSITKVHFSLAFSSQSTSPKAEEVPKPLPLTAIEERQLLEGTASIAEADLREAVRRAWRRGWQLRRDRV